MQISRIQWIALAVVFCAAAFLTVPDPTYLVGGDFFHTIWSYKLNLDNLVQGKPFYEMNILYPFQGSAPLHEISPLNTLLFIPFYASGNYLAAIYFLLLFHAAATGIGSFFLLKNIGVKNNLIATLGGITILFPSYRIAHAAHINSLTLELLLLGILLIFQYLEKEKGSTLLGIFLVFLLLLCGPSYLMVCMFFFLLVFSPLYLFSSQFNLRRTLRLAGAIGAALICNAHILWSYAAMASKGYERKVEDASDAAVNLYQLIRPAQGGLADKVFGPQNSYGSDLNNFFPGYALAFLILAAFLVTGICFLRGKEKFIHTKIFSIAIFCSLLLLVSFGPNFKLGPQVLSGNPVFQFFYDVVPALKATRYVPYFGFVATSLLIVLSIGFIDGLMKRTHRKLVAIALILMAAGTYFENRIFTSLRWQKDNIASTFEPDAVRSYMEIDKAIPDPSVALISLPIWGYAEYNYMYYSLFHHRKIYNGLDGFYPHQLADIKTINSFPAKESLELIKSKSIGAIVVHRRQYDRPCLEYANLLEIKSIYQDHLVCLFYPLSKTQ